MERRRPITEDDLLLTEFLLARSYGNLKKTVVRDACSAAGSLGGTMKKHPYATAGVAVGAGVLLSAMFALLLHGRKSHGHAKGSAGQDMTSQVFSMLLPVIAPYITGYLEKFLGGSFPRGRC